MQMSSDRYLSFLEQVWQHGSNNELLLQVRNVPTYCKRVDNCLACGEKVVNVNVLLGPVNLPVVQAIIQCG